VTPPPGSRPLGFVRVPKPVGEMTDEERRAFAEQVVEQMQVALAQITGDRAGDAADGTAPES